ncbi:VIT1/CCC1 transporter family protein [Brucepastera parasyntrophica]|uniref:VIT1/CCC1 transporter family protein n=1 Tax=Brucepastera parasyntrophica TaxID=2880008 RepID=UPI002109AA20|nr:VIT1/CCC1 transporter family protein [Brucepastera parasyntrophica]ULQ59686.1 VIT1/CCC1 transporter family protein [Brucepastera parasyntrophica]
MQNITIPAETRKKILKFQQDEVTSACLYEKLLEKIPDEKNRLIMKHMAEDESRHAERWESFTGQKLKPERLKVWFYFLLARILGLSFTLKRLEKDEANAQDGYKTILEFFPETQDIILEEEEHEASLIAMIDEDHLKYAGSIVLGLNDALVELTGALAGFTFAFQNTRLIAVTGLITGISAALSMASSEYLSQRSEENKDISPLKAAAYTGIAYIIAVILLVMPFFFTGNFILALGCTIAIAVIIIFFFNYYLCTAKTLPFRRHFLEMVLVCFGVTLVSFLVGFAVKYFFGIEI